MGWFAKLFRKKQDRKPEDAPMTEVSPEQTGVPAAPKAPYLTQTVVYGMHMYRSAGEDSTVCFVDEARGIRKMLVDCDGRIQNFPGMVKDDFWVKDVPDRYMGAQIRFRTSFEKRGDGWIMLWQIWPDGRYWEDDDGFGMTNDEEITLYTFVNSDGEFTGPFRIYRMGRRNYYTPAQ